MDHRSLWEEGQVEAFPLDQRAVPLLTCLKYYCPVLCFGLKKGSAAKIVINASPLNIRTTILYDASLAHGDVNNNDGCSQGN